MMEATPWTDVVALTDEVRLTFHRLAQVADTLHAGVDITVRQRAVLEYLHRNGPSTVPDLARARGVARQHFQPVVNELSDRGLVEATPNPAHRRSSLVALTTAGVETIESVQAVERSTLTPVLGRLDHRAVTDATATLRAVRVALDEEHDHDETGENKESAT